MMPYMSLCVVMIDLGNLRDQIFPRTGFAPSDETLDIHPLAIQARGNQRSAAPRLRPVTVRVVHNLQHHILGIARRAASKPHTRGAVCLARENPKQVVAQRCAVQSIVP